MRARAARGRTNPAEVRWLGGKKGAYNPPLTREG